jgi:hypothetical protein
VHCLLFLLLEIEENFCVIKGGQYFKMRKTFFLRLRFLICPSGTSRAGHIFGENIGNWQVINSAEVAVLILVIVFIVCYFQMP